MDNKRKKTLTLITITGITLVLGVIAIVTALRLRTIGTQPVAPTAPQSQPQAQVPQPSPPEIAACIDSFSVDVSSCGGWCDSDNDCSDNTTCYRTSRTEPGICRNPACVTETDCTCPTPQHLVCNTTTNACELVDGAGDNECNADSNGDIAPECLPETYTVCNFDDQTCETMTGSGQDQCVTYDDCTQEYTVCENEACVVKTGAPGNVNECDIDDPDACKEPVYLVCKDEACVPDTTGTAVDNECDADADCQENRYNVCENFACVTKTGDGDNQCANNDDCEQPTHKGCENNACVTKIGGGINSCQTDADCGPANTPTPGPSSTPAPTSPLATATSAPVSTPVPTTPALPQAGTTAPTVAIITMGAVLLLAGLAAIIAL